MNEIAQTESVDKVKQVIVMRTDLNMRKGKMIAQGAHASSMWILHKWVPADAACKLCDLSWAEDQWITNGNIMKAVVRAESEQELDDIYNKAKEAGLTVHMIVDSGKTEFHGVPTKTCLAIGPDLASDIDKITGHLKLL